MKLTKKVLESLEDLKGKTIASFRAEWPLILTTTDDSIIFLDFSGDVAESFSLDQVIKYTDLETLYDLNVISKDEFNNQVSIRDARISEDFRKEAVINLEYYIKNYPKEAKEICLENLKDLVEK